MKKNTYLLFLLFVSQIFQAQNTCSTAQSITTAGIYSVGVINGTQIPSPLCASSNGAIPAANNPAGEWYAYTPTQNFTVTVTTDISANTPRKDTRFHVYTGTCSALICYSGDDDTGLNYSSVATFNVTAGTTYFIAFDNRWLNTTNNTGFSFQLIQGTFVTPTPSPITYVTQTVATINSDYNLCVVDMNSDFKDDIVGVSSGNLRIHYQGTTPGVFTPTDFPFTGVSYMPGWSMAAGDYNKDGYNDLVLGSGNGLSILRSNSTGTAFTGITPGQYIFCQRTNFADLNNDGNLDIFSCHDIAPNVYYLNNGAGVLTYFQSSVTPGAMSIGSVGGNYASLFTDFDNDGDSDVFISKCSGPPCELHRNDGNGVYTDISALAQINITPIQTWSSAIADFDNDGDMDIIITASAGTHKYFRNNLNTSNSVEEAYSNITTGSGWDTNTATNIDNIAYDFDNNGFVDVLGANGKIMFNQGNSTFSPVNYSGISVGAVGDLNNDGFLDFLNGNTIRYAVPNANKWLKVTLNGVLSNKNGIGARITIYGAFGQQIRDIRSGEGFKYMSSLNAHFGLGTANSITQVVIKWPSGIVDTILNPGINQTLMVFEGATLGNQTFGTNSIVVYPNPAKDFLTLKIADNKTINSVQIIDLYGKTFKKSDYQGQLLIQDLPTGTYIIVVKDSEGNAYTQKFLKE